ncbi:flagellar basal body rod C-terminal domain-containing protein [Desulfonatronovibrio hydrogenovorans]|uniref:flagellar basal body rod C-terminal domain-containing protein n=1 Tax=Desulfonatronovibrio hydrogenovorans TaxID=53245 RepID=UPI000691AC07|nr:flagellar basal body rod C-terminal domain-containing protein [Desulfonatronovibrio hydrogenovorans]
MQPIFSAGAMKTFAQSHNLTAHNLANLNTDGFKARELHLETGPDGKGVEPAGVFEDQTPGPAIQKQELVENDQERMEQQEIVAEASNTEPAREIVRMIADEQAFQANAQVVRTYDRLAGNIIDILV